MRQTTRMLIDTAVVAVQSEHVEDVNITYGNGELMTTANVIWEDGFCLYVRDSSDDRLSWEMIDKESIIAVTVNFKMEVPSRIRNMLLPDFITATKQDIKKRRPST